jgi:ABC-type Fe3+-hydroxamate transport system substrate-binding protein
MSKKSILFIISIAVALAGCSSSNNTNLASKSDISDLQKEIRMLKTQLEEREEPEVEEKKEEPEVFVQEAKPCQIKSKYTPVSQCAKDVEVVPQSNNRHYFVTIRKNSCCVKNSCDIKGSK